MAPPITVTDSRRLTGPNLIWDRVGAVLDLALDGERVEAAEAAWRGRVRALLDAVGWRDQELCTRRFPGGISLAISAPIDGLYAACELNEQAWAEADGMVGGGAEPATDAARLAALVAGQRNPRVLALREEAGRRGVTFVWDDDAVTLGLGAGSSTWAIADLPDPAAVDWSARHDVPVAMITGTNGKSTTVRLLGEMVAAAGRVPGLCSTDWIRVGDEIVDRGDWSGPGGARAVVRDRRTEVALLETARGGMLRRGLGLERADVALITNIAADHMGEYGVHGLEELVETKFLLTAIADRVVLNADDPRTVGRVARGLRPPITWFGLDPGVPTVREHLALGGEAIVLDDEHVVVCSGEHRRILLPIAEAPFTLGGAARFNVSNALAAVAVALALDLPDDAIVAGLHRFGAEADQNPGRGQLLDAGGVKLFVDFAHNPHGVAAIAEMARGLGATRTAIVIGQAGDRDDDAIRELARACWGARPDLVVVKDMPEYLRGRRPGEVPEIIVAALREAGAPEGAIERADDELAAMRRALEWSRPGDLLLLTTHARRDDVLALTRRLVETGWRPGEPVAT